LKPIGWRCRLGSKYGAGLIRFIEAKNKIFEPFEFCEFENSIALVDAAKDGAAKGGKRSRRLEIAPIARNARKPMFD
jgi:hypothetical protein